MQRQESGSRLHTCQWTRILTRLVNPNCYEPEARPDGGPSSSAMHAGCSDHAYYLPILAPAPSLIPSPISTTGWATVPLPIDLSPAHLDGRPPPRPAGASLQDLGPSPPGSCRLPRTAALEDRDMSPPNRSSLPPGRRPPPGPPTVEIIRCLHSIIQWDFDAESGGPLHDLRGPRDHAGRPPPRARRSPGPPPHDLPLRPSSRSRSR
jgi:hypothetical protein